MKRIYLDNNATSHLLPEVLDAMMPYWTARFGNPSSLHQEGRWARRALETAREQIADLLEADPDQIVFTSGGTEANNLAVLGFAGGQPGPVITSTIEHPSVLGCVELLKQRGYQPVHLPVDWSGVVASEEFSELIEADTRIATVMLVNNETGALQPVGPMAAAARCRGISFHTDAVQAVGRMPVSFRSLGVTSLSFSAHKFHGPIGIGGLIVNRRDLLQPVLTGGHQEMGLRPGTEPVALVIGMAKALEIALNQLRRDLEHIRRLRNLLECGLRDRFGSILVNGPVHERLVHTSNLRFPDIDAQAAVLALDLIGLACSTGSACASGASTPSHALMAMGLSEAEARNSIRFSLSRLTTEQETMEAIDLVSRVVAQQQNLSKVSAGI